MKETSELSCYCFKLNILGINEDKFANYQIVYGGKKIPLKEFTGKEINNGKELLEFTVENLLNSNFYQVKLKKNFFNEISLIINEDDDNAQLFDLDFMIQNESPNQIKLIMEYKNESYTYSTFFNDLNIGKIVLLGVDLKYLKISFIHNDANKEKNDLNYEKYKLLGKKRSDKKETKSKNIIDFKIDYENLITNKLLFCLHFFNDKRYILTIHENIDKIQEKVNKNIIHSDLEILDNEIEQKINHLLNLINDDNCDLETFKGVVKEKLAQYNYKNPSFEEDNYFVMLEYFKKYIACITCKTIIKMIDGFFGYYTEPSETKINILKKNIKYTLLKYEQFNEYIKYINGKKSQIENLKIKINNLTDKEKIEILSTLLTILLSSPIFDINTKIEFMDIEDNPKSIYFKSIEFFKEVINKLNEESYYVNGFRQTFSRIKKDINELNIESKNEKGIFIIELRDLEELKCLMKKYLPSKIVRFVNAKSQLNAIYDIYGRNIIINEIIYINREKINDFSANNNNIYDSLNPIIKGDIDLKNESNLFLYNLYTFKSFWRIIHESFGHKPVSIENDNKMDTPGIFIINGKFHKVSESDAGKLLEYYVSDTREMFEVLLYKNYDAKNLLNVNLFIDIDFKEFWEKFSEIKIIEEKVDKIENPEKEAYLFMVDIFEEEKESNTKIERYVLPRFLWPTHMKLLSTV